MAIPSIPVGVFNEAVKNFWKTRDYQARRQQQSGRSDQGGRGAATGGKQMGGFGSTIVKLMMESGVDPAHIFQDKQLTLPGFFRPTKAWDILVVRDARLIAAVELKSHVGSFGNNFNNRTEEAMGTALDTWTAYREGAYQGSPQPFLGYLLLLEDTRKSRRPVRVSEPHFSVFEEFRDASYTKRYELLCRRLVLERQYTAACFLTSDPSKGNADSKYAEPAQDLDSGQFLSQLLRYVIP